MINEDQFFREVTLRICGNLDISQALFDTFLFLKRFLPLDQVMLAELEFGTETINWLALADENGVKAGPELVRLSQVTKDALDDDMRERYMSGEVLIIDPSDFQTYEPQFHDRFGMTRERFEQGICVIHKLLRLHDSVAGDLSCISFRKNAFTEKHAELIRIVNNPFAIALTNALRYSRLLEDNRSLYKELQKVTGDIVIGAETGLKQVLEMVSYVASLDSPVLLLGETGVGKDVIANLIHRNSERVNGPLVRVNCGAISDSLIDSELFGHEKGAFTGATQTKRGLFERANGGTIFLDEIGELPLSSQTRLLHVLQNMTFDRVGGSHTISVDVRIVAATNRDLEQMVADGRFREDLWYRLNVFPILMPPLRERREDIPALVNYFISKKVHEMNLPGQPMVMPDEMKKLVEYKWPGNVRELQNAVERALILNRGETLTFAGIERHPAERQAFIDEGRGQNLLSLDEAAKRHIEKALEISRGKISGERGAAALLGINSSTLRARMRKLKIPFQSQIMPGE